MEKQIVLLLVILVFLLVFCLIYLVNNVQENYLPEINYSYNDISNTIISVANDISNSFHDIETNL